MKRFLSVVLALVMVLSIGTVALASGEASGGASGAVAAKTLPEDRACEHTFDYLLQPDSYEATDATGGYRHYVCSVCGAEYAYHTDPLVYAVNPVTGRAVDQAGTKNPYLPLWEHIPDGEPHVFWSKTDGEWRVYVYGSHDVAMICGDDHVTWSAPVYDLSDWRYDGEIHRITFTDEEIAALTERGEADKVNAGTLFAPDCAYDVVTDAYYLAAFEVGLQRCAVYRAVAPDSNFDELGRDGALYTWNIGSNAGKASDAGEYALTDPAIIFVDGVMYVGGNIPGADMPAKLQETLSGEGSPFGSYAVIYRVEEIYDDMWGVTGISTCPTENAPYLPVGEGISLRYLPEYGLYVMVYFGTGSGRTDGVASLSSGLNYSYTDDLMNGVWKYGENGFGENVILGNSGIYYRDASGEMASGEMYTFTSGNNHGGIEKINGEYYIFDHRSGGGGRQGVAEKINIHTDGYQLLIDVAELTSSGPAGKLDAYQVMDAGIACYLKGGVGFTSFTGNHDRYTNENIDFDVTHYAPLYGSKDGAVVGYKYLDFGEEKTAVALKLLVMQKEAAVGAADVYIDAPSDEEGGRRIGTITITPAMIATAAETETGTDGTVWHWISGDMEEAVSGVHGVYLVFHGTAGTEICKIDQLCFAVR